MIFRVLRACKGAGGFIGQLGGRAVVSSVSTTRFLKRAVMLMVSSGQYERVVAALIVSTSRSFQPGAKKFAMHAQRGEKRCFQVRWASYFAEGLLEGTLFRGRDVLSEFCSACWHSGQVRGPCGALHGGSGGGFARHEAVAQRVVGVSDPHVVQFPRTVLRSFLCAHRGSSVC